MSGTDRGSLKVHDTRHSVLMTWVGLGARAVTAAVMYAGVRRFAGDRREFSCKGSDEEQYSSAESLSFTRKMITSTPNGWTIFAAVVQLGALLVGVQQY